MRYTLAALALAVVLGAGFVWASVTDAPWEDDDSASYQQQLTGAEAAAILEHQVLDP